jgi:hypothetical protein
VTDEHLPDEADALYDERPDAFVAARNALVKSLRSDKRRDDATAVAALRRPTPASWSLNQVARHESSSMAAVLDAGAALQGATARAVSGKKGDLRAAQEAQRKALDVVLDAAVVHGRSLGTGNLDQLRRRASNTLHAAIADDDAAARLRAGRLDDDLDAPGFGFGFDAGFVPAADDGDDAAEEDAAEDDADARAAEARAALDARIADLQAEADKLDEAAKLAERAAREARKKADAAEEALADARAERD